MAMKGSNAPDLAAMFKNHPIGLWVEDPTTEVYLNALWQTGDVGIFIAGGWPNLESIVENCQRRGLSHVFGYRDRDFSQSNRAKWQDATWQKGAFIYKGDALEVENLALQDDECIAACVYNTAGLTGQQVGNELLRLAKQMKSWMACRQTLQALRHTTDVGFPKDPPDWRSIKDQKTAFDHIVSSPWWTQVNGAKRRVWKSKQLKDQLKNDLALFSRHLADDSWRSEFSGKELLQALLPKIWRENDRDALEFVKAIAEQQRVQSRIPPEVTELRASLLARAQLSQRRTGAGEEAPSQ